MNIHTTTDGQNLSQQATSLYALREEYCTKLEKLIEANAEERSEALGI